jgi:hypothetical protein
MCCEPGCGALETSFWGKSKRAETLGQPWCNKCNLRYVRAPKKALKVGRCRLTVSTPVLNALMVLTFETIYHELLKLSNSC